MREECEDIRLPEKLRTVKVCVCEVQYKRSMSTQADGAS